MKRKRPPTPHNPDPERYIIVRGKYRDYLSLKRGTRKKATVNETLQSNNKALTELSPLTGQIKTALEPFTFDLDTDRVHSRMNGLFLSGKEKRNKYDLSWMKGLDFQRRFPLMDLLKTRPRIEKDEQAKSIRLKFNIGRMGGVRQINKHVTAYAIHAILLHGKLDGQSQLKLEAVSSPVYDFEYDDQREEMCTLELPYPKGEGSWLLCVRVECYKGPATYFHFQTRGMMAIDGGEILM